MEDIKDILMKRDGITAEEADDLIQDAQKEMDELLEAGDIDSAENICELWFGLEPDFLIQLL